MRQGNVGLEMLAGHCLPNTYILGDADRQTEVAGYVNPNCLTQNKKDTVGMPVFIIEEESACCCRCCCPGMQPLYAKWYMASGPPLKGKTCCCFYLGHLYQKVQEPAFLTLERDGCDLCRKWMGCVVCGMCCQEDMYIHHGDPSANGKPGKVGRLEGGHFARLLQPCGGGGFHPKVNILTNPSKAPPGQGDEQLIGSIDGPMCMKGCLELFCDTSFFWTSPDGEKGDIGSLVRPKPEDCYNCCRMMCTNVDTYTTEFTDGYMSQSPEDKAAILSSLIQLDYMFFEDDRAPCEIEPNGQGGATLYITLCYMYCYGCQIPCQCCFQCDNNGGGGG